MGAIQAVSPLGFWWLDPATVYALGLSAIVGAATGANLAVILFDMARRGVARVGQGSRMYLERASRYRSIQHRQNGCPAGSA